MARNRTTHGFAPVSKPSKICVSSEGGKAKYDAGKNSFAHRSVRDCLVEHLKEEITTFEALEKVNIDWPAWNKKFRRWLSEC